METAIQYSLIAVLYGECLLGFTVNLILVAANFMKWKNLKSLPTGDKILSSLAVSRALYFVSIVMRNCFFQFFPWVKKKYIFKLTIPIPAMFMFYTSQWFATILCVFYCVKIVTYNCKLFIFLKTRISSMLPWLILGSLPISLISSLLFNWYDLKLPTLTNGSRENMTDYGLIFDPNNSNQFLIFFLASFPPFVIFCVANFILIQFLLIHTRRMRSNESQIQTPNLKSHFSALKSMSLFLLLQILFFICTSLLASRRFFSANFLVLTGWIILCSLQLLHSLYIISSSSDVRKMFSSMYPCLIRFS